MSKNELIIAAAGSGKTTYLVNKALSVKDNVLITTFTENNSNEIRRKIYNFKGFIPKNVTVQTWFSFLLKHCVRPYQSLIHEALFNKKIGFFLYQGKSGFRYKHKDRPVYWGESDTNRFYFTSDYKIYSDKISKFAYECNKRSHNEIVNRLSRIYPFIFIDEVQDLAGWDLELLKLFLVSSSTVIMVGDPRQGTYTTNDSPKHKSYRNKIHDFIREKCSQTCMINTTILSHSHRNNKAICNFSSKLFPEFPASEPCDCTKCRTVTPEHSGIFLVNTSDVNGYCEKFNPQVLRYQQSEYPELNFGVSKGLGFDRVLVYPTKDIITYIKNGNVDVIKKVRAKFYVAMTRARHSVAIVFDLKDSDCIEGIQTYSTTC